MNRVRACYADFGPTLACAKLRVLHGLEVSLETLRQWMIAEGVWIRRARWARRPHQPRHQRSCLGEWVQFED